MESTAPRPFGISIQPSIFQEARRSPLARRDGLYAPNWPAASACGEYPGAGAEWGRTDVAQSATRLAATMVAAGRVRATGNVTKAVAETDVSLVCVGTPSRANGGLNLAYVERVCTEIGEAIRAKGAVHTLVIRSTVLPGTAPDLVVPALEKASGLKSGVRFHTSGRR